MCLYLHHRVAGPGRAVVGLEVGAERHVHRDELHVRLERRAELFAAESVLADCKVTSNSVQPGWARGEREGSGEPRRN